MHQVYRWLSGQRAVSFPSLPVSSMSNSVRVFVTAVPTMLTLAMLVGIRWHSHSCGLIQSYQVHVRVPCWLIHLEGFWDCREYEMQIDLTCSYIVEALTPLIEGVAGCMSEMDKEKMKWCFGFMLLCRWYSYRKENNSFATKFYNFYNFLISVKNK